MTRPTIRPGAIAMGGLTPLLDTLFLLLFALLAISDVRREDASEPTQEVAVELPPVAPNASAPGSEGHSVAIVIDAESRLVVGPQSTPVATPRELDRALDEFTAGSAPASVAVTIRADRAARHGVAVELLAYLRARGHRDVVLMATADPDPDRRFGDATAEGGR